MSAVQDLERKVQSLHDQLKCAEDSLYRAKLDEFPIKVGDRVRIERDTEDAIVAQIDFKSWGGPWISVYKIKKNGEPYRKMTQIFSDYKAIVREATDVKS